MQSGAMTQLTASCFVDLQAGEDRSAPEWVELIPAGPNVIGRDGRAWVNDRPDDIVSAFTVDLPIDYEHASEEPAGQPAPAAGWVKEVQNRGGAVWGRVEWVEAAANMIAAREYRFLSPTFFFSRTSTRIARLRSAALTHHPNLDLKALNRSQSETGSPAMNNEQRKALCKKLGLADEASDTAILGAVEDLQADVAKAENAAQTPDLDKFVPRADHDKVVADLEAANNSLTERDSADVEALVDQAIADEKITPSNRDFYVASCKAEGGVERFKAFVAAAPKLAVAANSGLDTKDPDEAVAALSADDKLIADQLGLDHGEFSKSLKAEG